LSTGCTDYAGLKQKLLGWGLISNCFFNLRVSA
jgi:hypothetical protein